MICPHRGSLWIWVPASGQGIQIFGVHRGSKRISKKRQDRQSKND